MAKSTVVRHAIKDGWQQAREDYKEQRQKSILKQTAERPTDIEEGHLKKLRIAQNAATATILEIGMRVRSGDRRKQDASDLNRATSAVHRAIMAERSILGMRTKPITFSNPDSVEDYQIMMGTKESPPSRNLKEMNETIDNLGRMIEREKMLEAMRDGTYYDYSN